MKLSDIIKFKSLHYSPFDNEADEKVNALLRDGWRIIEFDRNPNGSSRFYFGRTGIVKEESE
ncbi:Hypothetical protein Tcol_3120 [Trichococcus collinsii]|uniref:DUF4177 domain-containing protein n=1 Tax=Trichococcus collinsii TaxID=157076 RepID=A0AB38A3Y7_9LACT|nr:Hypothetical protein Tcol_3120 [Trichococcus collinsii]SEA96111.1 hypothetical protein SAMN04488525_11334 [Trichococcus collinsii]